MQKQIHRAKASRDARGRVQRQNEPATGSRPVRGNATSKDAAELLREIERVLAA